MRIERQKDSDKAEIMRDLFPPYIGDYITITLDHLSPGTVVSYLMDIKDFFEWTLTSIFPKKESIKDITLQDLEQLDDLDISHYRGYLKNRPTPRNLETRYYKSANCERTINRKMCALRSLFAFLHRRKDRQGNPYLSKDIMEHVEVRKVDVSARARAEKLKSAIIKEEEIDELINFILEGYGDKCTPQQLKFWQHNRDRDAAIFILMLTSGMRVGELTSLRLGDINLEERTAIVDRKRNHQDVIPFSFQTAKYIETYLEVRTSYYKAEQLSSSPLFVTKYHKKDGKTKGPNAMSKNAVQKMIMKYAQVYGKPNLTAHILRHSFGTNVFNKTKNLRGVQELLGHSSNTTTEVYTHIFDDDKTDIIDEVFK